MYLQVLWNDAHYGYNCPSQVSIISNSKLCNNQTVDELPQTLPSFDPTCYSGDESSFTYDSTPNFVDDSPNVFNPPSQPPTYSCEFYGNDAHYGHDCPPQVMFIYNPEPLMKLGKKEKELHSTRAGRAAYVMNSNVYFIYYDDDDDEESSIPLSDVISELPPCVAITPVLSTEEPDNSFNQFEDFSDSNDDSTSINAFSIDNIDYVEASPPHSELIETLKDNPTPSSDFVTKSPSTSPNSFLEETNISYNSLPESETFCFNLEEKSSGNPTSYTNLSLPDYEAFFFDCEPDLGDFTTDSFVIKYPIPVKDGDSFLEKFKTTPELETFKFDIEEKNSGNTNIHADISLPDLECFYFKSEPDPGDLTSIINPEIRENVSSTTYVNLPSEDDQYLRFSYVVWIFLSFLTYPVVPPYLLSSGNEDTIFDTGISIYHSFMPGVSHRNGTFVKFNVYTNHLNESSMEILSSTCSPMDQ
ncbi:hypothetical protein Tco_1162902 [Tanacetum coccineum]